MKIRYLPLAFALSAALCANALAQTKTVQATDLIDIFEKLSGKHPGLRKAHAAGICASGRFEPSADAGPFAGAPLLSGGSLPVAARFSLGGGDPNADETAPGTRGMGVQISLPDGSRHIFTGNNFPVFPGKDRSVICQYRVLWPAHVLLRRAGQQRYVPMAYRARFGS